LEVFYYENEILGKDKVKTCARKAARLAVRVRLPTAGFHQISVKVRQKHLDRRSSELLYEGFMPKA
jgi:hypothetical protein